MGLGLRVFIFVDDDIRQISFAKYDRLIHGDNNEIIPISKQINVEKFIKALNKVQKDIKNGHETRAKMRLLSSLRYVKFGILRKYILPLIRTGSYDI